MGLTSLVEELERQKENSLDLINRSIEQVRLEEFGGKILESSLKDFEELFA